MSDLATQLYTVTPAAGQFVAGVLHDGVGTNLPLTPSQARYELLLGSIVPEGTPVPPIVPAGPVTAQDRVAATRGSKGWDFSVADLSLFLVAGPLRLLVDDHLGVLEERIDADLRGLAARIAALDQALGRVITARDVAEAVQGPFNALSRAVGEEVLAREAGDRATVRELTGDLAAPLRSLADIAALIDALTIDDVAGLREEVARIGSLKPSDINGLGAYLRIFDEEPIASAETVDLATVVSRYAVITGSETIRGFGAAARQMVTLRFAGAATLKHAVGLALPGSVDLVTAPGDTAIARSDGDGQWRITDYRYAWTALTPIADASVTLGNRARTACITALTAPRTLTLPSAAQYPVGEPLTIVDTAGVLDPSRPVTVAAADGQSLAGSASLDLTAPYQSLVVRPVAAGLWIF